MVKLHEYQSKVILRRAGIRTPKGGAVITAGEARAMAIGIGSPVVVKAQVFVTGRAGKHLIHFADSPDDAADAADRLLKQSFDGLTMDCALVEERVKIEREFYVGLIIDVSARAPVLIFSPVGGSGIEEIAAAHPDQVIRQPIDIRHGLRDFEARDMCRQAGLTGKLMLQVSQFLMQFYEAARSSEARAAEINPLALTASGDLLALDARFTVDDYAVFRHPELNIDIAREFDRPPTKLERIAWDIEKSDYRGTFYFIQMETNFTKGQRAVGFHGNGGGGAMISMDALFARGFKIANFVDTSGNPPASKVYRAARLILSQTGIDGYFLSGSGVASQEQYHSARGLVKAFMDVPLNVPAVIRIGGNGEEQAIEILHRANGSFPAPVEAYGRDTTPDDCTARMDALIASYTPVDNPTPRTVPTAAEPYRFETVTGGTITYDHAVCQTCTTKACVHSCDPKILSLDGDKPVLNISREDAKRGGCTECLACEVECYFNGARGAYITLPIPGLEEPAHA
ncbi:MAG: acetate--CoA ligase family protein [Anaerolineae bacterium]|nr:acetate--CoA ligase family protein [Anaerolineae bacterium]